MLRVCVSWFAPVRGVFPCSRWKASIPAAFGALLWARRVNAWRHLILVIQRNLTSTKWLAPFPAPFPSTKWPSTKWLAPFPSTKWQYQVAGTFPGKPVDVPTNQNLKSVCCASDGLVYAITTGRDLLVGRDQSWRLKSQGITDSKYESIVEFDSRIILSIETVLLKVMKGVVRPAALCARPSMRSCSFLAAGYGILVVPGGRDVCSFDGVDWSVIAQ
jgi:hypothetical protein